LKSIFLSFFALLFSLVIFSQDKIFYIHGKVVDEKTGYVWYSDLNGNNIARFDPKTEQFVEYPVPTREAGPKFIALDGKGRVWFTEVMGGKIGVLDTGDGSH
jgi:streptogramin lyase